MKHADSARLHSRSSAGGSANMILTPLPSRNKSLQENYAWTNDGIFGSGVLTDALKITLGTSWAAALAMTQVIANRIQNVRKGEKDAAADGNAEFDLVLAAACSDDSLLLHLDIIFVLFKYLSEGKGTSE